jgi:hypothetical protein
MELSNVVVRKENVEMMLMDLTFADLGKSYGFQTEALVYKVKKADIINPLAKEWLESGNDVEASVRMQYVKVDLAMNSNAKGDEEELKNYQQYIDSIANKDDFENINYFWIVKEAKNVGESSLVLAGSNSATGLLRSEPSTMDTQTNNKNEPSIDTHQIKQEIDIYNLI